MKKLMILGSRGMLGHMVYHYFQSLQKYEVIDVAHNYKLNPDSYVLDVTNQTEVESLISIVKPDVVINCIGILIKGSNNNAANAIYINAYFPHQLSKLAGKFNFKLIHISTDCVFSGETGGYKEEDFKDARDVYGLSKALGELENDRDLTLRTSIIGPELKREGEGLFHWFLNQNGSINGYTKSIWGGVTTLELSKAIDAAIDQNLTGLIHITNGSPISKYELGLLFKKLWNLPNEINPVEGKNADKSLKCNRTDFVYEYPSYMDMLIEQFQWMQKHVELYFPIYKNRF